MGAGLKGFAIIGCGGLHVSSMAAASLAMMLKKDAVVFVERPAPPPDLSKLELKLPPFAPQLPKLEDWRPEPHRPFYEGLRKYSRNRRRWSG